jgi:hypothetical protein
MYVRSHFGSSKMPRILYSVVPSGWHVVSGALPVAIVLPLAADADTSAAHKGLLKGNNKGKLPPRPPAQDIIDKGLFKGKHKGLFHGKPSDIAVQDNIDKGLFKGKHKGNPSDIAVQDNTDSDIGPDSDSSPSGAQNDIGKGGSQNPYLQAGKGLSKGYNKAGKGEEIKGKHKEGKGKRSRSPWRTLA